MARYNQDPRSSTFYNPRASIKEFQAVVPVEKENGQIEQRVDMLDPKMMAAIRGITQHTYVKYDGTVHITTISFTAYGTTTWWWAIMMYNGFIHPLEIEPGTIIKIPARVDLESAIEKQRQAYEPGSRTVLI